MRTPSSSCPSVPGGIPARLQSGGCCSAGRGQSRKVRELNEQGHRMTAFRDRWAGTLPRVAVVLHDLAMVWLVWQGLHWVRYGVWRSPAPMPLAATGGALVLGAQGLVVWRRG